MRASGHQQQTHYQRGGDKKDHEAYLPDDRGNSGPLAHPSEEPPQKRKGQRRRQAHSEASHAHHPHTFPCLAKPGGVKAHPHLRGPHQTGIGGQRLGAQSTYYDVGCFRIIAAGFAFLQVIPQPKLAERLARLRPERSARELRHVHSVSCLCFCSLQPCHQQIQSAIQPRLHRAHRRSSHGGDFFQRHAFLKAQDHGLAILRRNADQHRVDAFGLLVLLYNFPRRRPRVSGLERRVVFVFPSGRRG